VDDRVNVTLAGEAVQFLERSAGRPFFLYFTPVAVHNPVTPNKQFRGKSAAGLYGDYVGELDWAVGQVLSTLDRLKTADNTLVLFSSDNGGVAMSYNRQPGQAQAQAAEFDLNLEDDSGGAVTGHYRRAQIEAEQAGHRIVGDLRGRKHSIYEGGFRVPYLVRFPGRVRPGSTSSEVVSLVDTLATCCGLLNESVPRGAAEDSYDVLPAWMGRKLARPIREATVLHNAEGVFAIRQGQWKLIEERTWDDQARSPWRAEAVNQLYDLNADPAEKNNVWDRNPEVVARLGALLRRYREQGYSRP
jgi:arylsulfatase A-like enzyme